MVRRVKPDVVIGLGGYITFPGGKYLRSPLLALGMLWHRLKELT